MVIVHLREEVANELECRAEGIQLGDVVCRRRPHTTSLVARIEALVLGRCAICEGRGRGGATARGRALIVTLGTNAVAVVDLIDRSERTVGALVADTIDRVTRERVRRGEILGALDRLVHIVVVGVISRGIDRYATTVIAYTGRRNDVEGVILAGDYACLHRARNTVTTRFAHCDFDDTARRIGVVVGPRNGDHLDLLHILGIERAEVGRQVVAREVQHTFIDHNARARRTVDRDVVALHPNTGGGRKDLNAVLADRNGGVVGHVDHKAVGLAGDQSSRYDHLANRVRGGHDCDIAQIGR